jgi:hypothetical protein
MMERELNNRLNKHNIRAIRIEGRPSSPTDIDLFEYDYDKLAFLRFVCTIDLERKFGRKFINGTIPSDYCEGLNYLSRRKIDNPSKSGDIIYLIYDDVESNPDIFWNYFFEIKRYGIYRKKSVNDCVYSIPHNKYYLVHKGWDSLISEILSL